MHQRSTRVFKQLAFICLLIIPSLVFSATINQKPYLIINNSSAAIVDLDGDGYLDVVIVAASDGSPPPPEPVIVCIEPGDAAAKKKASQSGAPLPPPPPPPDRGLWVHVLDGAPNPMHPMDPPYSQELSPNHDGLNTLWPRQLAMAGGCGKATSPTVAVKDIDFSGTLSVVVGGPDGMYAYGTFGALKPGFPGQAQFPPFFNAPALRNGQVRGETAPTVFPAEAYTVDGLVAILGDDNSTYHQRWNGVARRRHCQFMGDIVYSSPSVADVGTPGASPGTGTHVADGVPDEVSAADGTNRPPNQVSVWEASDVLPNVPPGQHLGMSQACDDIPQPDLIYLKGAGAYRSSAAFADFDGDLTQDIVIQHDSSKVQLFLSNSGSPIVLEYNLASGAPKIVFNGYGSPAVVNLSSNPSGPYNTIVIGSDGGIVYALRYYNDVPTCLPSTPPCLKPVWQTTLPDSGAISASPAVARLTNADNGFPQVIVANDAGKVYVLQGSDGTVVDTFGPLGGMTDDDAAVFSTPAVWTRKVDSSQNPCQDDAPGNPSACPIIVTGNRHGLFEIVLVGYPPFNPDPMDPGTVLATQWPTFHRSNTRTGALVPAQDGSKDSDPVHTHNRGSIGGVVDPSCEQTHVRVYQHDGVTPVIDYYTGVATDEVFYNHRYLFELVTAADPTQSYKVRFNNNPANDVDAPVDAGKMTRVNHADPCL